MREIENCWIRPMLAKGECPNIDAASERVLLTNLRKRLYHKCAECKQFVVELAAFINPNEGMEIFPQILGRRTSQEVLSKLREQEWSLKAFSQVFTTFSNSQDQRDIYHSLLTILASEAGFGFRSAILLLVNQLQGALKATWGMEYLGENGNSILDHLKEYELLEQSTYKLAPVIQKLIFPLDKNHPVTGIMLSKRLHEVREGEEASALNRVLLLLETSSCLFLPLWGNRGPLGMVLLDKGDRELSQSDLRAIASFTSKASSAIERVHLYQRVGDLMREKARSETYQYADKRAEIKIEKVEAVNQLTSKIAHEIRNPVSAIGGLARYLLSKMDHHPQREVVEAIAKEAEKLENLVNQVHSLAEDLYPSKGHFDLVRIVKRVLPHLQGDLPEGYNVVAALPDEVLLVNVDPNHVKTVLCHLVENGIEAMPKGGTVTLGLLRNGSEAVLTVEDQGEGIPPSILKQVEEPFFTTKEDGTGLGLAICRRLLEENSATLALESTVGIGTKAVIRLPLLG